MTTASQRLIEGNQILLFLSASNSLFIWKEKQCYYNSSNRRLHKNLKIERPFPQAIITQCTSTLKVCSNEQVTNSNFSLSASVDTLWKEYFAFHLSILIEIVHSATVTQKGMNYFRFKNWITNQMSQPGEMGLRWKWPEGPKTDIFFQFTRENLQLTRLITS